jgi:hypothetical protein
MRTPTIRAATQLDLLDLYGFCRARGEHPAVEVSILAIPACNDLTKTEFKILYSKNAKTQIAQTFFGDFEPIARHWLQGPAFWRNGSG